MGQVAEWLVAARCGLRPGRIAGALALAAALPLVHADDFAPPATAPESLRAAYDVVVAGAGTGGIGAAIQAARLGASVLLLEETDWVGGQMLAAAVSAIDEGGAGNLVRGRGLYQELVRKIEGFYHPLGLDPLLGGRVSNLRVEPRVGRQIVHAMLEEAGRGRRLDLSLRSRVVRVIRTGATVTGAEIAIATPQGRRTLTVSSQVLIDATEWGDVLPLSGARYRAGNHLSDALDPARHIQDNTWTAVIKHYPSGVPPALRIATPPPGSDQRHEVFAKAIVPGDAPRRRGAPMSQITFVDYRGMPDSAPPAPALRGAFPPVTRTHLNYTNDTPCTVAYLEDPAQRVATDREMRLRTLQLLHYVQNVLGMRDWSVADDEGFDTAFNRQEIAAWLKVRPELEPYRAILIHFSVLPYVRESRRIVGRHTLLAREISRGPGKSPTLFPTSIALGDYRLDLHGGRAAPDMELDLDRMEDLQDAQPGRAGPFAIPFECLIPESTDGFLAAEKNFSQSRLVNGATRMQPHTLNVGQAVGALAALAVRHGVPPRRIDPVLVQRVLLAAKSTLHLTPLQDVAQESADWAAIQLVSLRGLLPLEEGRFHAPRPLRSAELPAIQRHFDLPVSTPGTADAVVTRAAFARALTPVAGPLVTLQFHTNEADAARAITRSEAAQVLAELLELRALGALLGAQQTLRWEGVKPASFPPLAAPSTAAARHLQRLVDAKIIASGDYWAENAVAGRECDGARVAELLLEGARRLDPQASPANAVDVLHRFRIISAPEYWTKSAVPGGHCVGKNVAAVIRNLAEHPAVSRRGVPASAR